MKMNRRMTKAETILLNDFNNRIRKVLYDVGKEHGFYVECDIEIYATKLESSKKIVNALFKKLKLNTLEDTK